MLTSVSSLPGAHSPQTQILSATVWIYCINIVVSDGPKESVTFDLLVTCFIRENMLINWLKVFQMLL